MISRKLPSIALVLFSTVVMCAAEQNRRDIELKFETDAVITDAQVVEVTKLALECGLPSVKEIYTYHVHPGGGRGIGALSHDTFNGREFTTSCILINYKKWGWEPDEEKERKNLKQHGEFWALKGSGTTSRGAIFSTRSGPIRVFLDQHTPLQFADKVVAAMEARELRFKNDSLKKRTEEWHADLGKPIAISQGKDGKCYIGVSVQASPAGMSLECVFDGDGGLTVIEVHSWIS